MNPPPNRRRFVIRLGAVAAALAGGAALSGCGDGEKPAARFDDGMASGRTTASADSGFTAKVDATGLAPGREYFYRFRQGANRSPVGHMRTLPAGDVAERRLAVLSCANHPAGFSNVHAEAARADAQYALHPGDCIFYEYGAGGCASQGAAALGRNPEPAGELPTLADHRRRHAQYRSDPDAQALHARLPMIAMWDGHELGNDA